MIKTGRVVVIGAGLAGLSTAWRLTRSGIDVTVLEALDHPGGLAASFKWRGFTLDIGPHKFYPQESRVQAEIENLMGSEMRTWEKKTGLWMKSRRLDFPLSPRAVLAIPGPILAGSAEHALSRLRVWGKGRPDNTYEDYVVNRFGRYLYELLFRPQAEKLWGPPATLSADLGRIRLPFRSPFEAALTRGGRATLPEVDVKEFSYPVGGAGRISVRLAEEIIASGGEVLYGCRPDKIAVSHDGPIVIQTNSGERRADVLVSTIHPADLVGLFEPAVGNNIQEAARSLRYRSLILCCLAVRRPRVTSDHWIVFPEKRYCFNRLYEPKAFGVRGPDNETVLVLEMTVDPLELGKGTDQELVEKFVADLCATGLVSSQEITDSKIVRIKRAYPVLDLDYRANRQTVLDYLNEREIIISVGRWGLFAYGNMDHSIDMGLTAGQLIVDDKLSQWGTVSHKYDLCRIID